MTKQWIREEESAGGWIGRRRVAGMNCDRRVLEESVIEGFYDRRMKGRAYKTEVIPAML